MLARGYERAAIDTLCQLPNKQLPRTVIRRRWLAQRAAAELRRWVDEEALSDMENWRRHYRASSLYGRGEFAAASLIYEEITRLNPRDSFAAYMLARCYEYQERLSDALYWAEVAAAKLPASLTVLQLAARLAVAIGDHEKATEYVSRTLMLPDVMTEMPHVSQSSKLLLLFVRALYRMPFVGRRLRPGGLDELQAGNQAVELQQWKQWAEAYLAWRNGNESAAPERKPH